MSIAKKSLIDYFAQNAALVVTFVSGILVSVVFGKEGRGEYALALMANLILMNLTNMGVEVSARVFAGKNPKDVARIHTAGVILIGGICVIIGLAVYLFMSDVRDAFFPDVPPELLRLAVFLLPFSLYQLLWQGVMVGMGEIGLYARFFMWNRLIQGGAIILLLSLHAAPEVSWLLYMWVGIQIGAFIISLVIMSFKYRLFARIDLALVKKMLGFSWLVYFGNFAASLIQKYDMLMISRYIGAGGAGIYSQASTFSDKVTIISGSLERAAYMPATHADAEYAPFLIQKLFRYNLYVNLVGSILMYIFGAAVIRLILPPEFLDSLFPLKFLLLSVIFMSCSRILAIYFTAHLQKPHIPGIINWFVLPVSVLICYMYTRAWGVKGAALAIASVYFVHAIIFFVMFFSRNPQVGLRDFFLFKKDDYQNIKKFFLKKKPPVDEKES